MADEIHGGCRCGGIRYKTTPTPIYQLLCYCTDCQTIGGSANYAAYGVPIETIILTKGKPHTFSIKADSGRTNSRRFCTDCGTQVWAQIDELGLASVNAFSLDDSAHFQPDSNHCSENAPDWARVDNELNERPRTAKTSH